MHGDDKKVTNMFQIYTALQTKDESCTDETDQEKSVEEKSDDQKVDKEKNKTTEKIKNFALGHLDRFIDRETEMEKLSGLGWNQGAAD